MAQIEYVTEGHATSRFGHNRMSGTLKKNEREKRGHPRKKTGDIHELLQSEEKRGHPRTTKNGDIHELLQSDKWLEAIL